MPRKFSDEVSRGPRSESLTVLLSHRQVAQLDTLSTDIRLRHRRSISRAEIIRGIIDAAQDSRVDLSKASSGAQIAEMFAAWRAGRA